MIHVRTEMDVHELDGKETDSMNKRRPQLIVRTHPMKGDLIVLEFGERTIAVAADDLIRSIRSITV